MNPKEYRELIRLARDVLTSMGVEGTEDELDARAGALIDTILETKRAEEPENPRWTVEP